VSALLAADPLFNKGVDLTVVLIVIGKTIVVFALLLVAVMFYIWFMRKVIADMQNRIGPAKAGPFGVFQTLADGIKLFFKEQSIPDSADRRVFRLAPYLSILPAFLSFSIVPIGGLVTIAGHQTNIQLADPPIGVLFLLAMSGIGLYGVMLAGWSSGSKYPLLGAVRASAQLLSYEAALGLAVVGVLARTGTLSTSAIAAQQAWTHGPGSLGDWFWITAPVPFVIFLISAIAETNHPPFDLVEAEQELVGGFHTEYTGIRFAIFFLAEFMNVITMSAIAVTLFLGGPAGPFIGPLGATSWVNEWLTPIFWFLLKLLALLFCTVWVRAALPRLRYDQLMNLGWKYLIEIAVLWDLIAFVIVVSQDQHWNTALIVPLVSVGAFLAYGVLYASMPRQSELDDEADEFEDAK
jgi:NADH-quinone oxidoreductase subunit H